MHFIFVILIKAELLITFIIIEVVIITITVLIIHPNQMIINHNITFKFAIKSTIVVIIAKEWLLRIIHYIIIT